MPEETGTLVFALQHLTGLRRGEEEMYQTERISIGRGRNNQCTFDPEKERSVSHRHCEIRIEDSIPILYDIGSLNGTYVNGRRIRRSPLADGDEIGLGREGPRMRFLVRSGRPPDAVVAAEVVQKIGGTAQEARPSGIERLAAQSARLPRYRLAVGVLAAVCLSLIVGGLIHFRDLTDRIEALEQSNPTGAPVTTPAKPPSAGSITEESPRRAPVTPDRVESVPAPSETPSVEGKEGTVSLVVKSESPSGVVLRNWELGAGAIVGQGLVVTTLSVFDEVQALRQRSPAEKDHRFSFVAVPAGRTKEAVLITDVLIPENPESLPYGDLAVLVLAPEARGRLPRVLFGNPTGRRLRAFSPGLRPEDIEVIELLDARGDRISGSESPVLLRTLSRTGHLLAGTPLFAGTDLAGLSLGPSGPGLAVASPAIKAFVEAAEGAPPRRIRGR